MSNIILIGYMGCGKSTIGIRLSYLFRKTFCDTDKMIEREQDRSISDIFEKDGEGFFRDLETMALKKLQLEKGDFIIAVGGGLPLREENRQLLKEIGTIIYLRVRPETVLERLEHDTTRPLLVGLNQQEKITEMIRVRAPKYEACADFVVDVDGKSFDEITDEIQRLVDGMNEIKGVF